MKIKFALITLLMATVYSTIVTANECDCADALTLTVNCGPEGGSLGYGIASPRGGVGPYSYSWQVWGASILGSSTNSYIDVWGTGSITLQVTVTDQCNNSITRSCSYSGGGGGPLKNAAAAFNQGMNVAATLQI